MVLHSCYIFYQVNTTDQQWEGEGMSTFHGTQQSDPKPSSIKVTDKKELSNLITELVNYLESGRAKTDFDALATIQPLSPSLQAL